MRYEGLDTPCGFLVISRLYELHMAELVTYEHPFLFTQLCSRRLSLRVNVGLFQGGMGHPPANTLTFSEGMNIVCGGSLQKWEAPQGLPHVQYTACMLLSLTCGVEALGRTPSLITSSTTRTTSWLEGTSEYSKGKFAFTVNGRICDLLKKARLTYNCSLPRGDMTHFGGMVPEVAPRTFMRWDMLFGYE